MKCPHCTADLLYRERSGRRCSKCRQEFALEPKLNSLHLHDLRLVRIAEKISQYGTLGYTAGQLYHAVSFKAVKVQQPFWISIISGTLITGVLAGCILGALLAEYTGLPTAVIAVLVSMLVIGMILAVLAIQVSRSSSIRLPMKFSDFQQNVLASWQRVYGALPPGMIDPRQPLPPDPAPVDQRAVLACPVPDILTCLRANRVPERLGIGLLPGEAQRTPHEEATLAALRANPQRPLLILHDASPEGCTLARSLPLALGLRSEQLVIDIGLHPRQAMQHNLMRLSTKPSPELLRLLQKRITPSASATTPQTLSQPEFDWLKQGFYTPLSAVSPVRLIRAVEQAVARAVPQPAAAAQRSSDPEQQAQHAAQVVGFLTWPE
jgi:hypothetical protein